MRGTITQHFSSPVAAAQQLLSAYGYADQQVAIQTENVAHISAVQEFRAAVQAYESSGKSANDLIKILDSEIMRVSDEYTHAKNKQAEYENQAQKDHSLASSSTSFGKLINWISKPIINFWSTDYVQGAQRYALIAQQRQEHIKALKNYRLQVVKKHHLKDLTLEANTVPLDISFGNKDDSAAIALPNGNFATIWRQVNSGEITLRCYDPRMQIISTTSINGCHGNHRPQIADLTNNTMVLNCAKNSSPPNPPYLSRVSFLYDHNCNAMSDEAVTVPSQFQPEALMFRPALLSLSSEKYVQTIINYIPSNQWELWAKSISAIDNSPGSMQLVHSNRLTAGGAYADSAFCSSDQLSPTENGGFMSVFCYATPTSGNATTAGGLYGRCLDADLNPQAPVFIISDPNNSNDGYIASFAVTQVDGVNTILWKGMIDRDDLTLRMVRYENCQRLTETRVVDSRGTSNLVGYGSVMSVIATPRNGLLIYSVLDSNPRGYLPSQLENSYYLTRVDHSGTFRSSIQLNTATYPNPGQRQSYKRESPAIMLANSETLFITPARDENDNYFIIAFSQHLNQVLAPGRNTAYIYSSMDNMLDPNLAIIPVESTDTFYEGNMRITSDLMPDNCASLSADAQGGVNTYFNSTTRTLEFRGFGTSEDYTSSFRSTRLLADDCQSNVIVEASVFDGVLESKPVVYDISFSRDESSSTASSASSTGTDITSSTGSSGAGNNTDSSSGSSFSSSSSSTGRNDTDHKIEPQIFSQSADDASLVAWLVSGILSGFGLILLGYAIFSGKFQKLVASTTQTNPEKIELGRSTNHSPQSTMGLSRSSFLTLQTPSDSQHAPHPHRPVESSNTSEGHNAEGQEASSTLVR